ncbi:MAG TPA: BMP family ABC transporter substrate-binding protein [Candidatus Limnocylindrales bacterium]|nr:BMP family ABC transporter substrate-binding protein [Candidatus Limnocylindrales bacterium]
MKGRAVSALGALAVLALSACGSPSGSASSSASSTPFKAAWIYVGSKSDAGWTKAHDDGRLYVVNTLGSQVQTTYKENVPEGPQVTQVIEQLVRDGNKIIFATSFGYQDAMDAEAKLHPDVKFEQATGFKTEPNLAEYYGAGEDADYLTGMALGAASKTGHIGFVAPFPIPEVIREINAVTLGAQAMHPGATVQIVWTNTWFDPTKEKQAAQSLIQAGVDAIGQGQDSPATGDAAKAAGVKWSGYDSDQQQFAPDVWLTGTVYHWGPYYLKRVQAAINGTWKTGSYYGNFSDGFVDIAPFGTSVPQSVRDAINQKKDALKAGTFYEFTGPIKDQSGQVKVPAGQKLTLQDILTIDWFVQGVIGNPKGS